MTIMGDTLKFSLENAKLDKRLIFNIPAGYTCPRAVSYTHLRAHET